METLKEILAGLWEGYKSLVVILVTFYLILFFLIGGEFSLKINWKEFFKLFN